MIVWFQTIDITPLSPQVIHVWHCSHDSNIAESVQYLNYIELFSGTHVINNVLNMTVEKAHNLMYSL